MPAAVQFGFFSAVHSENDSSQNRKKWSAQKKIKIKIKRIKSRFCLNETGHIIKCAKLR